MKISKYVYPLTVKPALNARDFSTVMYMYEIKPITSKHLKMQWNTCAAKVAECRRFSSPLSLCGFLSLLKSWWPNVRESLSSRLDCTQIKSWVPYFAIHPIQIYDTHPFRIWLWVLVQDVLILVRLSTSLHSVNSKIIFICIQAFVLLDNDKRSFSLSFLLLFLICFWPFSLHFVRAFYWNRI